MQERPGRESSRARKGALRCGAMWSIFEASTPGSANSSAGSVRACEGPVGAEAAEAERSREDCGHRQSNSSVSLCCG